jgi:hypothetical protein
MNGRRDATGRRHHGGTRRTRSRASVATRQVVAMQVAAEVESVWPQEEVAAHGVVDGEPRDEPSGATSRVMSRVTCRGTRTRGVVKVVDDEPAQGEVIDDESRDKPHDVLKQADARRR